ncbi:MAG: (deoxy)nucleoside triphosphate pyrophosphohydrolase [Solobacterium sp.]|nr:(deoxy)nucleoside triphosphate pyrophosphohydrolase [Solobacterium sp.]
MKKKIHVVASVIENKDKILIARRNYGEFEGLWEFPGGKYELGESGEDALVREIQEEFDAQIVIKDFLCTIEHDYDSFYLIMDCFICTLKTDELHLHDHSAIRWIDCKEENIEWVPADKKVIEAYRKNHK